MAELERKALRHFHGFDREEYHLINHSSMKRVPVGFCYCDAHPGYLSKKLMCTHGCLKKKCPFFRKNKEHTFFQSPMVNFYELYKKEMRKIRKEYYNGDISFAAFRFYNSLPREVLLERRGVIERESALERR